MDLCIIEKQREMEREREAEERYVYFLSSILDTLHCAIHMNKIHTLMIDRQ